MRLFNILIPFALLANVVPAWDEHDHHIFYLTERLIKVKNNSKENFYTLLGVRQDATQDEITKSFRKLSAKLHPDRNIGNKKIAEEFEIVNSVVQVLREQRERYNNHLRVGIPRWAHGGFYFQSWRPSVFTVLVITLFIAGVIQYISAWILYVVRRDNVDEAEELRNLPAAKLAKELQKRGYEFTKSDLKKQGSVEKILQEKLTKKTVIHYSKPEITDIFFIKYPLMIFGAKRSKDNGPTVITHEKTATAPAEGKGADADEKKTN